MKASQIVTKARSFVGIIEKPNNNVIFNTAYYGHTVNGSQYPWCCAFVWYVFHDLKADKLFYDGKKTAYCPTLLNWFKSNGRLMIMPEVGDIVFYDFSGKKITASHVGIVSKVLPGGRIIAIEGNTSSYSQTNGGMVQEKERDLKYCIGFGRPEYDSPLTPEKDPIKDTKPEKPVSQTGVLFHEQAKNGVRFIVTASSLKIRKDAPDGAVIDILDRGTNVMWYGYHKIVNGKDLWLYVTDGKHTGYMCKQKGDNQYMA